MDGVIVLPEWLITSSQEAPRQGWGIRIEAILPGAVLQPPIVAMSATTP